MSGNIVTKISSEITFQTTYTFVVPNGLYYLHRGYVKKQLDIPTACDDVEKALALGLNIEEDTKELICSN